MGNMEIWGQGKYGDTSHISLKNALAILGILLFYTIQPLCQEKYGMCPLSLLMVAGLTDHVWSIKEWITYKGRDIRNKVLDDLMRFLWSGMVDKAIEYIRAVKEDWVKDRDKLDVLVNYIERNRLYIPCYGVRKKLGLRNSSVCEPGLKNIRLLNLL